MRTAWKKLISQLIHRIKGGSGGADYFRLIADVETGSDPFFYSFYYAGILGDAASHHELLFHTYPLEERIGLVGYGLTHAPGDVGLFLIVGDEGDDFRFGENRAHAGYLYFLGRIKGGRAQLRNVYLKSTGDHLQKAARAGSALGYTWAVKS